MKYQVTRRYVCEDTIWVEAETKEQAVQLAQDEINQIHTEIVKDLSWVARKVKPEAQGT